MVEFALHPNAESSLESITDRADAPNKYWYPEFAGWHGERYLKKLLRQILPMALYRTWEIFADHQAQGGDCYLGITRLAEIAGRATRTMEKNLASLCAKQLLVERAERKVFRRAEDGTLQSRVVVVKDFRGLYALAHEYHEWTLAPSYVAPDREVISLLEQEPHLIAKLRRFENYRRVLYTRQPGPTVLPREEDRWFTEYRPESAFHTIAREEVARALPEKRDRIPTKLTAKEPAKDLAKGSLKRIKRSTRMNTTERASVDSAGSALLLKDEEHAAESGFPQKSPHMDGTEEQREALRVSTPAGSCSLNEPSAFEERMAFSPHERNPGQQTTCVSRDDQPGSGLRLTDSFLAAIAGSFGDQSPKGTQTRVRACWKQAHLSHPAEMVTCLIRAYLVARDTPVIRSEHRHPKTGQANRMPLFCAMAQRFAEEHRQGRWPDVSWRQMEEAIAADECLTRWWSEHHHLVDLPPDLALHTPQGEPKRPDTLFCDEAFEAHACTEKTPVRQIHHARLNQDERPSTDGSGKTSEFRSSAWSAPEADQYHCYINALMAQYSAPEACQVVR